MKESEYRNLSREKQYLLRLSDAEIRKLIHAAQNSSDKIPYTAGKKFVLPESAKVRLKNLNEQESSPLGRLDASSQRWRMYIRQLQELRVRFPAFYDSESETEIYARLKSACEQKHLPTDFALAMIPSVMEYVRTSQMKPIILNGPPGCGKTEAAKILAEIIGIPHYLIPAVSADRGHGLHGIATSYVGADVGEFVRGMLQNHALNVLFVVDEVEKAPRSYGRASIEDELLTVCDDSLDEFTDNFLAFPVPLRSCPIIMTCNDLTSLSEPLRDRCDIFSFHEVELARMKPIILEYAQRQLSRKYSATLLQEDATVEHAVEQLYTQGIRSIRQHEKLVDNTFRQAYAIYMESRAASPVTVSDALYREQLVHLSGGSPEKHIGF